MEGFIPVEGFEGKYLVSNDGRVYSTKTKKLLKPMKNEKGYLCVELRRNHTRKVMRIHRLVAGAFIPNSNNFNEVNHKDGDKENNSVANLEWCTRSQNMKHAYLLGLRIPCRGKRKKVKDEKDERGMQKRS